jgi:hypothetical protein
MAFGPELTEKSRRNFAFAVRGLASDISTGTATSGAVTLNDLAGKITTDVSSAADGAEYTLTITNASVAAADMAFASATLSSGTANGFAVSDILCGAGTLTITITNTNASAWSSAVFVVSFFVVKAL